MFVKYRFTPIITQFYRYNIVDFEKFIKILNYYNEAIINFNETTLLY